MTKPSTPTVNNHSHHQLSWPLKIAIALFLLPLIVVILTMALQLPLPTLPFVNFSGSNPPEYIFFMEYRSENVPGSVLFSLALASIGLFLIIKVGLKNCGYSLQQDVSQLISGGMGDKNNTGSDSKTPYKSTPQ